MVLSHKPPSHSIQIETIVAISSPPVALQHADAAIAALPQAMLRLSGPNAAEFADTVFRITQPEPLARSASSIPIRPKKDAARTPADLVEALAEKKWRRIAGHVTWQSNVLKAHAYIMPAPKSYTREHVVELHVPGLPWLISELLDALIAAGARAAQPGEFTRRAFENGRITLEQAEAVAKLIASSTADEARAHAAQLAVHAGVQRRVLKKDLEDLLAQVELGLDFSHEDVVVISLDAMAERLEQLRKRALKLAADSAHETERSAASHAPRILLVGPTNAGKSRLFNVLLKRDAAIVSAERHTTRDTVEAPLHFAFENKSFSATLIDSAGSGEDASASAQLSSAAWSATQREMKSADIILLALDRSIQLIQHEGLPTLLAELEKLKPACSAIVWTKCDLPNASPQDESRFASLEFGSQHRFEISALTGIGVDQLEQFLAERTAELSLRTAAARASASAAIRSSATAAAQALERASDALRDGCGEDVVAVELREAIHAFWQSEGIMIRHDAVTEAALDIIFSQFCVGK